MRNRVSRKINLSLSTVSVIDNSSRLQTSGEIWYSELYNIWNYDISLRVPQTDSRAALIHLYKLREIILPQSRKSRKERLWVNGVSRNEWLQKYHEVLIIKELVRSKAPVRRHSSLSHCSPQHTL